MGRKVKRRLINVVRFFILLFFLLLVVLPDLLDARNIL